MKAPQVQVHLRLASLTRPFLPAIISAQFSFSALTLAIMNMQLKDQQ